MSAESCATKDRCDVAGLGEPIYFASGDHTLFGWLHRGSAENARNIGLVICKPFGFEAICSHKSVRAFAEVFAAAGVPALRFDYLGTGDSADIDPQANQLDLWVKDLLAAIGELRRRTGVERVCLLGIRLGALMATVAARQSTTVAGLILISPIVSGARYVKELRTMQRAGPASLAAANDPPKCDGSIEAGGYAMSAATLDALMQVDLVTESPSPVTEMLIIDGSRMPGLRSWVESNQASSLRTQYLALPGLIEMIMANPNDATPPAAVLTASRAWLLQAAHAQSAPAGRPMLPIPTISELSCGRASANGPVTERPVFIASEPAIFGILCAPPPGELRRRGVIFVNSGASYHVGTNRLYVSLARQWAERGYWVLRIDLAGLGDSATRPGHRDNEVFPAAAIDDMRAAVEYLRAAYEIRELTLCGFCSGAYHALRAAAAALPVDRVLLVNLRHFFVKDGTDPNELGTAEVIKRARDHRERIFSKAAWKRLLAGRINVWRILRIYLQRPLLGAESELRDWARHFGLRLPGDVGSELEEIAQRGVRLVFVFAGSEAGIDLLRVKGGSSIIRLGEHCRVHVVDGADHNFSEARARVILEGILSRELFVDNRRSIKRADASSTYRPGEVRESRG